jgi:hypothetical protein
MRLFIWLVILVLLAAAVVALIPRLVPRVATPEPYVGAADEAAAIAFSPPVNGLSIALKPGTQATPTGPELSFVVYLRNDGQAPLAVCTRGDATPFVFVAEDGQTFTHATGHVPQLQARADFVTLGPSWLIIIPHTVTARIAPGRYRVRAQLLPPSPDDPIAAAIEQTERLKVWRGPLLESAEVALEVSE